MDATKDTPRMDYAARQGSSTRPKAFVLVLAAMTALALGCASYRGTSTATAAQPSVIAAQGQWTMVRDFPFVAQSSQDDCGAAALAAVLRYWGHSASAQSIEASLGGEDTRLKAGDMEAYARSVGLRSYVFYGTIKDVVHELEQGRPVIVGLGKMVEDDKALSHYEVVVGWEPNKKQLLLLDPARGWQVDSLEGFGKEWAISRGVTIVAFPHDAAQAGAPASHNLAKSATLPPAGALVADAERYAAKEATSPDAKKYRGGDYIVISATALIVILLVVIILILI